MPSSDATYYNIKRLHLVFAAASLALLGVTIWMLAADHWREWKGYQRTFRDRIEPWLTASEIREQLSDDFLAEEKTLADALEAAARAVPDEKHIAAFLEEIGREGDEVRAAYETLRKTPGKEARAELVALLAASVDQARERRNRADRQFRFHRARFDEARSFYEAAVGEGQPPAKLEALQQRVDRIRGEVDRASTRSAELGEPFRALAELLRAILADEDTARQTLDQHRAEVERLRRTLADENPSAGKKLLRLPLIDALGRPLAIDQIWLPNLTIDYHFRRVGRFDRCTTCHQGIRKTTTGSSTQPACLPEQTLLLDLAVPPDITSPSEPEGGTPEPDQAEEANTRVERFYGFSLAPQGLLNENAPTVELVRPGTLAADADLRVGDVIGAIDGTPVAHREEVLRTLVDPANLPANSDGEARRLTIRRGLPHPYRTHPRLDLFLGSGSPHPMGRFGCTICHQGQGSATAFKFASHTPNNAADQLRWKQTHGWFRNTHWDLPMRPKRFVESGCLVCHPRVTELAASRRFPAPPAPKLLAGYNLIRQHGCFGCHEIRGFDPSGKRTGPDMRLEPNSHEAAGSAAGRDVVPGTMRKVGPTLRHTADKLDARFLDRWLANPRQLRRATRMPQLFGLHAHLDGKPLAEAKRFEAVEIRAVSDSLLAMSQPMVPGTLAEGEEPDDESRAVEAPSVERGARLFLTQGCLACHRHADFSEAESSVGPDLSNLATKLTTERGRAWLAGWIRNPIGHSPRTRMPNTDLLAMPVEAATDAEAETRAELPTTDPAADIGAYLLEPVDREAEPAGREPLVESDLDALVLSHLGPSLSVPRARAYLEGTFELPAELARGDAAELLGKATLQKKIRYVGRRTIRKRGCHGCHDIAGFEDAQPIGPAFSDWGRRPGSLLAFEQVHRFVAAESAAKADQAAPDEAADADRAFYAEALRAHRREGFAWQKLRAPRSFDYKKAENKGYNEQLTMGQFSFTPHEREAIITFLLGLVADPPAGQYMWQGDSRSRAIAEGRQVIDKYGCAECHTLEMERWRMAYDPGQIEEPYEIEDFAFLRPRVDVAQLEAAERADRRGLMHAEAVGMPQVDESGEVLEDVDDDDHPMYYLNPWEPLSLKVADAWMTWPVGGAQLGVSDPFRVLAPNSQTAKEEAAEATPDPRSVAGQRIRPTYGPHLESIRPAWGGSFARMLFPHVIEEDNPAVMEAWGWVPPPLVGEGRAVEPAWLYNYLLEPFSVRPSVVLRMPKYNLSPAEARALVDYFQAVDHLDSQLGSDPRGRNEEVAARQRANPKRLDAAMRILIDRTTYCTKCHLVGDFVPGGDSVTVLGPRLDRVGRRIRPEYLRQWLANPKTVLPYTGMPANFPPTGPPIGQALFEGDSLEQLDAVVDLLLNYEEYMTRHASIRTMIEANDEAGAPQTPRDIIAPRQKGSR